VFSLKCRPALISAGWLLVIISIRGSVNLRAIARLQTFVIIEKIQWYSEWTWRPSSFRDELRLWKHLAVCTFHQESGQLGLGQRFLSFTASGQILQSIMPPVPRVPAAISGVWGRFRCRDLYLLPKSRKMEIYLHRSIRLSGWMLK
jgi:hypothetical protein